MSRKMTKVGFDSISTEIDRLWKEERPMVVEEVYQAALLGDRSENAAYIYGKQRLRQIDSRLQFLRKKLKDVQIVNTDFLPQRPDIQFGAWVKIEDEDEKVKSFRLVDQEESDPKQGRISIQSPVGKALLGQAKGDIITVNLPGRSTEYEVLEVHYGPTPESS